MEFRRLPVRFPCRAQKCSELLKRSSNKIIISHQHEATICLNNITLLLIPSLFFYWLYLAGEKISIDPEPSSPAIMKENVEKVLQFISGKMIKLHHVTSKGTMMHAGGSFALCWFCFCSVSNLFTYFDPVKP